MFLGDNIYTAISVARNCDMINKNSKVFLINIENVESSNVTPRLYIEHFGSTHASAEVAIPFDDSVGITFLFVKSPFTKKSDFSTSISLLMVKHGAN